MRKRITTMKLFNRPLFQKEKKENITLPRQIQPFFLRTLAELLDEGFSLLQCLQFMQILLPKHQEVFALIHDSLLRGHPIESALKSLGLSLTLIAQLYYAQKQGRFNHALHLTSNHLQMVSEYQKKLFKELAYPVLMGGFLMMLLFGMRQFLLPHVMSFISPEIHERHFLVRVLVGFFNYLPHFTLSFFFLILFSYLFLDFYLLKLPHLKRYAIYNRIPIINHWTRSNITFKLARQLSYFYASGYSILQTVETLIAYPIDPFLTEIAELLYHHLKDGVPLADILAETNLFVETFPLIIQQGEMTSQTAQKCAVYANKVFDDLLADLSKKISYIQPILFIVIAILVMAIYLLMMLPMLTMEGI